MSMVRTRLVYLVLLLLVSLSLGAQSSNGDFTFAVAGAKGAIQYNARVQGSSAKGNLTFTGTQDVSGDAVDDAGGNGAASTTATISVSIDCMRQTGNRAAMSGIVTSSNVPGYTGRRAILAVEDNGEGVKESRDAFTWGLYHDQQPSWTASDAEVPGDSGAMFSWLATDFEQPNDVGIPAGANAPKGVDCRSFSLSSYALESLVHGTGNIQVRP
ncbi:MAG TPA: hypothetical protein VND45_13485 [Thermoanaerobaculia bacterium]|jgi:hypothetical protein|nr:hypothetical protein [Thermoanaerobaculia bacterium]